MKAFLIDKRGVEKLPVLKSKLFWGGVFLKFIIAFFFASSVLSEKFAPFANYFIESGFDNPYAFFNQSGQEDSFPYPPLMLFLFSLPRMILWPLIDGSADTFTVWDSIIYRIPLFLADFAILTVLIRWLKNRIRQVLVWYWLSPVLIYINYFHGQLDVIPIALLFISLYLLFKRKWNFSFLILAGAIACKTNMALVLPFFVVYLYKTPEANHIQIIKGLGICALTIFLFNLPFLGSSDFIQMVYNNEIQQQVFDLYYQFNDSLKVYFIPAVLYVLFLWYLTMRFVNKEQLTLFISFVFLSLTIFVAPRQGWYYWIFPFLIYFSLKHDKLDRMLLMVLSGLYFIYFAVIPDSDYFNSFIGGTSLGLTYSVPDKVVDVAFSLLQCTLLIFSYNVFKKGIQNNIQAKFHSKPYLIGVGGDSASGKSTLTNSLTAVFSKFNSSVVRGDDMHKWERGNVNWQKRTHLDPKANNLHNEFSDTVSLKTGNRIKRRFYDHKTGKFTLPAFIRPSKLIVFEGLHPFYLRTQAELYDLRVFMEPEDELRTWWKLKRDVAERGHTAERVLEQLKSREKDSLKYIKSQSEFADIKVSFYHLEAIDFNNLTREPSIGLKVLMPNEINLDPLIVEFSKHENLKVEHEYTADGQEIKVEGSITPSEIEKVVTELVPELEDIGVYNSQWKADFEGFLQVIIVYVVFVKIEIRSHAE
jgi:uridine kinase